MVKIAPRQATAFCKKPNTTLCGALLYGADADLVAEHSRLMISALIDDDDLRLTRLDASTLRKDPEALAIALRSQGFFGGRPVVLIERCGEGVVPAITQALDSLTAEDGFLIVGADALASRSKLRKLFEIDARLAALGLYPALPTPADIEIMVKEAVRGCDIQPEAAEVLAAMAAEMSAGELRQLIEKISVFCVNRDAALTAEVVAELAPARRDTSVDQLVSAVGAGQARAVAPLIARLTAMGIAPALVLIRLTAHFRSLLTLLAAPNPEAAVGRLRPPVFGPRRDALLAQTRRWTWESATQALRLLHQTEATLRSPGERPDAALVERRLIHVASLAPR